MSLLLTLPQEVLEILLLYIEVDDLFTLWKVIDFEGSDYFWRKLCKREGFKNNLTEHSCWKSVFCLNINWSTQQFVKRKYKFDRVFNYSAHPHYYDFVRDKLLGDNLLTQSSISLDQISVWNIDTYPTLIQTLPAEAFRVIRNKLFTYFEDYVKVYSFIDNSFRELVSLEGNFSTKVYKHYDVTDRYFAVVDSTFKIIKVVNIENNESFEFTLSPIHSVLESIVLLGDLCYALLYYDSHVYLGKYNLEKYEWLESSMLYETHYPHNVELEVSTELLVVWNKSLVKPDMPLIKVWTANGKYLKSLSTDFIYSCGIQRPSHVFHLENMYSLVVEGDYAIFSNDKNHLFIWNSKDSEVCTVMDNFTSTRDGIKVISNHLLVLVYYECFKVVNFQKATYLYEVQFDNKSSGISSYYVNEHYYLHLSLTGEFKYISVKGASSPKNLFSIPNEIPKPDNSSCAKSKKYIVEWPVVSYNLTIYDFRKHSTQY